MTGTEILLAALLLAPAPPARRYTPATEEWNRPVAPFRVAGDLYYVGASEVSAYLIATRDGLVLLDGGFAETVQEGGRTLDVVFLCSLTAPGYRLVGNADYPRIVEDFRSSFRRVRALPCDVFLAPHGSFFRLAEKREAVGEGKPNPFVDREALARWVDQASRDFEAELEKQRKEVPPARVRAPHRFPNG